MAEENTQVKKNNKTLGLLVFFSLAISVGSGVSYYMGFQKPVSDKTIEKARQAQIIHSIIPELKKRYELGDIENLYTKGMLKCSDIPRHNLIQQDYMECNPHYLNCFFENGGKFTTKFQNKTYTVKANKYSNNKFYEVAPKGGALKLQLSIENNESNFSQKILLLDTCSDVYLPQRVYVYREHAKEESTEYIWNNFDREIYIDKSLVSFRDLIDWVDAGYSEARLEIPKEKYLWATPASNLSVNQMEQYCQFKGKQLVQSHILDAASFYPLEMNDPSFIDKSFPPFPWTKRKFGEELYEIQKGNIEFKLSSCSIYYLRECFVKNRPYKSVNSKNISWTGLRSLIGGVPEYVKNPFNPDYNIRASSMYLDASNQLNRLGMRISWNKESHETNSFSFLGSRIFSGSDLIKVGFRCMQEYISD